MIVEKVLQDREELRTIVESWSADGESLLIFEKEDTLVLKKIKKIISFSG